MSSPWSPTRQAPIAEIKGSSSVRSLELLPASTPAVVDYERNVLDRLHEYEYDYEYYEAQTTKAQSPTTDCPTARLPSCSMLRPDAIIAPL